MIIKAVKLTKEYSTKESKIIALNNIAMEIEPSTFISIMGPSGSGKSTLLHLLSGLDRPTHGYVLYDEKNIYSKSDKELSALRRQKIGFVFQQSNLLSVLTARENIIMPLLLDKKQPDETYFREIVDFLNIENRLSHLPNELSGGQQQRVAIARALVAKPDVLFADEPTGNLDSKSSYEVMELLKGIWREFRKTLVIITHDQRIGEMAEKRYSIIDGSISEVRTS